MNGETSVRKREAMRKAHELAALVIRQAQRSTEGWAEDQDEHDALDLALSELADRHDRAALATRPYAAPGLPDGAPERAREIAETMPTVGQWSGLEGGADRGC